MKRTKKEILEEIEKTKKRYDDCVYLVGLDTFEGDDPEEIDKKIEKLKKELTSEKTLTKTNENTKKKE